MSGGGGSQTVTQTNEPWGPLQPQILGYTGAANDWFYGSQGNPYTNQPNWQGQGTAGEGLGLGGGANPGLQSNYNTGPSYNSASTVGSIDPATRQAWDTEGISSFDRLMGRTPINSTINTPTPQPPQPIPYDQRTGWMNQQMVAGIDPATQQAWNMATQRATDGSVDPSMAYLSGIGQGNRVNPAQGLYSSFMNNQNPYLDQTYGRAANRVANTFADTTIPQIANRFGMGGRTGGGIEQEMYGKAYEGLGESLGNLATDIYGGAYNQQQANQLSAIGGMSNAYSTGLAQQLQALGQQSAGYNTQRQQDYMDIGQLLNVGQMQQAYQQQLIDAPFQQLVQYGSLMSPGAGFGSQTNTQPTYSNPFLGALGGAAAGSTLGPWGTAGGALLGYMGSQQR